MPRNSSHLVRNALLGALLFYFLRLYLMEGDNATTEKKNPPVRGENVLEPYQNIADDPPATDLKPRVNVLFCTS